MLKEKDKRMIFADDIKEKRTVLWDPALGYSDCVLIEDIDEAPTVDAVEVVRCKACKQHIETKAENVVYCQKFNRFMKADDFCSYGERRSDVSVTD